MATPPCTRRSRTAIPNLNRSPIPICTRTQSRKHSSCSSNSHSYRPSRSHSRSMLTPDHSRRRQRLSRRQQPGARSCTPAHSRPCRSHFPLQMGMSLRLTRCRRRLAKLMRWRVSAIVRRSRHGRRCGCLCGRRSTSGLFDLIRRICMYVALDSFHIISRTEYTTLRGAQRTRRGICGRLDPGFSRAAPLRRA